MKKYPTIQAMIQAEAPPPQPGAQPIALLAERIKEQSKEPFAVFYIRGSIWRVVAVADWSNPGTVRVRLWRLDPVAFAPIR